MISGISSEEAFFPKHFADSDIESQHRSPNPEPNCSFPDIIQPLIELPFLVNAHILTIALQLYDGDEIPQRRQISHHSVIQISIIIELELRKDEVNVFVPCLGVIGL